MADLTPNLKLTYISQSQAQKEITINEAFLKIDALLNLGIKSNSTTTPPVTPTEGDAYIIPASATGAWSGKTTKLAIYNESKGWFFITPNEGLTLWVNSVAALFTFNGTAWQKSVIQDLQNLSGVGINTSSDATNKLAVASDAVLFTHNGTSINFKINKNATANTASYIFQTNYSGRSEFGLIGNDDFTIKTSPDGSTWNESLIIKKDNSYTKVKNNLYADGLSFNNGTDVMNYFSNGTWTPVIVGATTAGTNTYTEQVGYYTRIGNIIIADYSIAVNGSMSSVGPLRLSGLPVNPNANCNFSAVTGISSSVIPTGSTIYLETAGNVNYSNLMRFTSSAKSTVNASALGTNLSLKGTLVYRV